MASLLRDAAGDYGACLSAQFPALANLLGEKRLGAGVSVSQDVGYEAVCTLLAGIARSVGLLLWVVDDAHQMDSAARGVLERLVPRLAELPIVVVCTSVIEPTTGGPFADTAGLTLEPRALDLEAVAALASEFLGSEGLDPGLIQQLHARSGGSPRGVLDLLHLLLGRGLLNAAWGHWALDSAQLRDVPLPASVERLALDRLTTLSSPSRAVLRLAAVAGRLFDPATLEAISELAPDVTEQAMGEAVASHLIERKPTASDESPLYGFLHEQVQACLAEELEPGLRADLHRKLALYQEEQPDFPGKVFEIARHWSLGVDPEDPARALSALTTAANAALDGLAFVEAERWFRTILDLAVAHDLACDYRIYRGLAEACMNSGKSPEAREHLAQAILRCRAGADLANMHRQMAELLLCEGYDSKRMGEHLASGWRALGLGMPGGVAPTLLLAALRYTLGAWLASLFGWGFGSKADDPAYRARYKLMEQTGSYAFMTGQIALLLYTSARNAFVSHRIGPSRELIWARAARAHTLSTFGVSSKTVDAMAQSAYDLADELGDAAGRARVALLHASARLFLGDVARGERDYVEVLRRHGRVLGIEDLVLLVWDLCGGLCKRGHTTRAREHLNYCEKLLRERSATVDWRCETFLVVHAILDTTEGRFAAGDASAKLKEIALDSAKEAPFRWFEIQYARLALFTEADDYGQGFDEALARVEEAGVTPYTSSWHHLPYWHTRAVCRYRQWLEGPKEQHPKRLEQFASALKALSIAARLPGDRWRLLHVQALAQFIEGKHRRALLLLSQAETLAQLHDSPRGLFITRLDRGVVLWKMGHVDAAKSDISWALGMADRRGWVGLSRGLRRRFQALLLGEERRPRTHAGLTTSRHEASMTTTTAHSSLAHYTHRERDALLELSLARADLQDPRAQADAVLDRLLSVLGGERAFVFMWNAETHSLVFYAARDARGQVLDADTPYARSLVQRVAESRTPLVLSGTEEGAELGSQSVVAQNLRSMICAPLCLRNDLLGVVYLDSRLVRGVFTDMDLSMLVGLANHIAIAHASALSAQRELERRAAERDLELSAAVQALLLPRETQAVWDGMSLAAHFRPASGVAGDWWYYDRFDNGTVRVVLGDVTGHGPAAAMVSAVVAGWYRRMRLEGRYDTPEMLRRLHEGMRELCRGTYMMPLAAIEVDVSGAMRGWSAAAPPLLIRRADGQIQVLQQSGTPLGGEAGLSHQIRSNFSPLAEDPK